MNVATLETSASARLVMNMNTLATQAQAQAPQALRVFVVDDYPMFRRGLAEVLAAERAFLCVGEAEHGAEAIRAAPALRPDVVIVDQEMPGMDGIQAIEALRRVVPAARFVLLASTLEASEVRRAIAAGATCILLKSACSQELVTAIHAAHRGHCLYPPAMAQAMAAGAKSAAVGADLTARERKLLELMARGLANHQISATLAIAVPTVKFHVTNILTKLQVENRTAAVLVALRHKLVELE
jgi:NarL family two-component system response regulator LiaR